MSNTNTTGCCGPNKPCNCKEVENPGPADGITKELKTEGNTRDGTPAPKFTLTDRRDVKADAKPRAPRTVFEKAVDDVTTENFDVRNFVFKFRERLSAILRTEGYKKLKHDASVRRELKLDKLDKATLDRATLYLYRNPLDWGVQANRTGKLFGFRKGLCVNTLTVFGYDFPINRKLPQAEFEQVVEIITSNYRDALEENLKNEELATKGAAVLVVENKMLANKAQLAKTYEELYTARSEEYDIQQEKTAALKAELSALTQKLNFANSLLSEFSAKIAHLESKQKPAKKVKAKVKAKAKAKAKKTLKKKTR